MKNLKPILVVVLLLITFTAQSANLHTASDNSVELLKSSRFQVGYLGSYYNYINKTIFISGYLIQHTYCLKFSEKTGVGFGMGLNKYEQQTFAPIYIELERCLSDRFFYNFQSGYAFGWKKNGEYFPEYSLNGGFYGGAGLGYRFRLNELFYSYLHLAYRYQHATLTSDSFHTEVLNFNSFAISIGIMLEKW